MPILRVEIAKTPLDHMQGLMGRKHLPKNSGMLFDFGKPGPRSFWMANTYIPLQIAFLDENGRVGQINSMAPLSTRPIYSKNSYRYALEVNDGWFDRNGIKVDSVIQLPGKGIYTANHNIMDGLTVQAGPKDWWKGLKSLFKKDPVENNGGIPLEPQPEAQMPQNTPPPAPNAPPGGGQPGGPGQPGQQPQQPTTPKTQIEQSFRDILKTVLETGTKVVLEYITKDGYGIPHKTIVPPMELLSDAEGHPHNLIRFFSETDGEWRSFLIEGPDGNGVQAIYDVMGNPIINSDQIHELNHMQPPTQEDVWLAKGIMTPSEEEKKQMEYERLLTHKT